MIGKTIGQYQVIDKIGEGGMGAVYKAEDTTLHRLVALKTLSGHLTEDEEARERFVREAQSASSASAVWMIMSIAFLTETMPLSTMSRMVLPSTYSMQISRVSSSSRNS